MKPPLRVLIVEDDAMIAEIIAAIIWSGCTEVRIVGTIRDAKETILGSHFSTVLLDLTLPDSTIENSLASVGVMKRLGVPRVVIITASPIDERLRRAAEGAGADEIIGKDAIGFEQRVRGVVA